MNLNKKTNRTITPLMDHNYSPDLKYTGKHFAETTAESYVHAQPIRDFTQTADYLGRRRKDDDYWAMTIAQLNLELDNNMNQVIFLLGRRKNLVAAKKRKIIEEMHQRLEKAKDQSEINQFDSTNDQDFIKITSFCQNPNTAIKMLGKIIKTIPEIKGPRNDEEERSQQFWNRNKKLETDIDMILEKLKFIDKNLQKQNEEVHEISRQLDRIQDTLKSFVGAKSAEHVQKVEPLFNSKKKNYDTLNRKIHQREVSKDKKIEYIKRISAILDQLKRTREDRLNQIAQFFGLQNLWEFQNISFKEQGDFSNGLEELLKIREKDCHLELSQRDVLIQIQSLEREQQKLYNQLLRKQSDQAKAFHNYSNVMNQRAKYATILSIFNYQNQGLDLQDIDPKEFSKKFKEFKGFFKKFFQEDALLKQGLMKTSQTSKTFINLLRATQNQKERRHELLGLLQTCIRKRGEYEQKREEARNIQFEQSRNEQEMTQFEQDLQGILTDGDLDGYKKIGNAIGKCEHEKIRLNHLKELLDKQMQSMDREVLSIANRIQEEYEDILCDVLPSDYQYSLKTGEDVKKLRNHLRKMYKRLGILNNQ